MTTHHAKSFKELRVYQRAREVSRGVFKLTDADAEQMETQHWIGEALDCGYLSAAEAAQLNSGLEEIRRMLNSTIHESTVEYLISPDELAADD